MPGLTLRSGAWPRPHRIIGRFLIMAALVLGGAHEFGSQIVEPLLPIYSHTIALLDDRFTITDARVSHEGASEILRFRADLARPVFVGGHELDPFGWARQHEAGFQITYTVGGPLQFAALLLIAVLAWPAGSGWEMLWRIGAAVPFGGVLLLLDVPITVVAELRNLLATSVDPSALSDWMVASRFLMGGGGALVALLMALLSIGGGQWLCDWRARGFHVARWHPVSRKEFEAFFRAYPGALDVSPPFDKPARRHTLRDCSLGKGRVGWVAECRTLRKKPLYRIRVDRAFGP
jgi:hypothetical protein